MFGFHKIKLHRFTYLRGQASAMGNVRRMRQERAVQQKASISNQRLALQMEQRAKAITALRLKKRSVRQRLGQLRVGGQMNVKARLSLPGGRGRGRGGFRGQRNVRDKLQGGRGGGGGMRRSTSVTSFTRSIGGASTSEGGGGFSRNFRGGVKKQFWRGQGGVGRRARGGGGGGGGRGGSARFVQRGGRGFKGGNFTQFSPRRTTRGGGLRGRGQFRGRGRGGAGGTRGQRGGARGVGGNRNFRGNIRRGRGGRGVRTDRGGRGGLSGKMPTREELDLQLDEYMANTKSGLDRDLDQYMNIQPENWD